MAIVGHILLGLLLAGGSAWLLQPRLLFYPLDGLHQTPSDWDLDYRDLTITTEDGERLHGWLVAAPRRRAAAPRTLLFLHGNAGNISHRGDSLRIFADLGLDVLIIDYRGYGESTGSPSERGLYRDAAAAWRWLTTEHGTDPGDIVVFGRSLGAAVAAELAARTEPAGLIVESGFDSLAAMARTHYPLLAAVIPLRYRFPAAEHIAGARGPVLVLHSPADEIVPYALGRRLFDAAPEPKRFEPLHGGHNDGFLRSQPGYQRTLGDFLDSLGTTREGP